MRSCTEYWQIIVREVRTAPGTVGASVVFIGWYYLIQRGAASMFPQVISQTWFRTVAPPQPEFFPGVIFGGLSHLSPHHLWTNIVMLLLFGWFGEQSVSVSGGVFGGFVILGSILTINIDQLVTWSASNGALGCSGSVFAIMMYLGVRGVFARSEMWTETWLSVFRTVDEAFIGGILLIFVSILLFHEFTTPTPFAIYAHASGAVIGVLFGFVFVVRDWWMGASDKSQQSIVRGNNPSET